jgi:hypothetical protein
MDTTAQYGQMELNLPHDIIKLPSRGLFYKPKKETLKVGFLTANDENLLMSSNIPKEGLVYTLLRSKIYEPGFDINQLLECDIQAVLLFLRNTSFGAEYNVELNDPKTNKKFETTILLEELDFVEPKHTPDTEGYFDFALEKTKATIKCKLLSLGETTELDKMRESYPSGMIAPVVTKKLEMSIVELNGKRNKQEISTFVTNLPISDSKKLKKFLKECEPSINLERTVIAPSGEKVTFNVNFGVEFFRPFFDI